MSRKFKQKPKKVKAEKVKREPDMRKRAYLAMLFNNRAAFDGGRREPWWVAVLFFIASIVIALVPAMVQVGKTKGSDIFKGPLYHTDVAFTKFVETLEEKDADLTVVSENDENIFKASPEFVNLVANKAFTLTDGATNEVVPYYSFAQKRIVYTRDENNAVVTNEVDFEYLRVYYTGDIQSSFLLEGKVYSGDAFLALKLLSLKEEDAVGNVTSHLIIGRKALYTRLYNPTAINKPGNPALVFEGRTNSLPVGMNIRDFGKVSKDGVPLAKTDIDYTDKVMENFGHMQDLGYKEVKVRTFWFQTGIYAAIFSIIGLVMGLIIFISTRGKMNPNRYLKFGESLKIGAWLLPAPALITLVLGFVLPVQYFQQYFQIIFIMTLGMRSVWLTMRTLNPNMPQQ